MISDEQRGRCNITPSTSSSVVFLKDIDTACRELAGDANIFVWVTWRYGLSAGELTSHRHTRGGSHAGRPCRRVPRLQGHQARRVHVRRTSMAGPRQRGEQTGRSISAQQSARGRSTSTYAMWARGHWWDALWSRAQVMRGAEPKCNGSNKLRWHPLTKNPKIVAQRRLRHHQRGGGNSLKAMGVEWCCSSRPASTTPNAFTAADKYYMLSNEQSPARHRG